MRAARVLLVERLYGIPDDAMVERVTAALSAVTDAALLVRVERVGFRGPMRAERAAMKRLASTLRERGVVVYVAFRSAVVASLLRVALERRSDRGGPTPLAPERVFSSLAEARTALARDGLDVRDVGTSD